MMFLSGTFLVVQPVQVHQVARAASARRSANVVSANAVSVALTLVHQGAKIAPLWALASLPGVSGVRRGASATGLREGAWSQGRHGTGACRRCDVRLPAYAPECRIAPGPSAN